MTLMKDVIDKISNGKMMFLLLFLALAMAFTVNFIDLPNTVQRINRITDGAGIPDTHLYYTADRLYKILDTQQTTGRKAYYQFLTTFDAVFPLLYSVALGIVVRVHLRKTFPKTTWIGKLGFVAIAAGFFDYLENGCLLLILNDYPVRMDQLARLAGIFTLTKWLFSASTLLLIAAGFVQILIVKRRKGA